MWSEERRGPVDRKKKRKYTCSFQLGESRGAALPNLLRVQRRSSALRSQQRLHICSLIRKQLLQTSGSAVKVKNTEGSCTDRCGNRQAKHQVSEALKSPDDAPLSVTFVINYRWRKGRWRRGEAGIATSWSDFGVFPSTRIPTREDSHCGGRGGGMIRESAEEVFQSKTQVTELSDDFF